jgi:hypothetical protein
MLNVRKQSRAEQRKEAEQSRAKQRKDSYVECEEARRGEERKGEEGVLC